MNSLVSFATTLQFLAAAYVAYGVIEMILWKRTNIHIFTEEANREQGTGNSE